MPSPETAPPIVMVLSSGTTGGRRPFERAASVKSSKVVIPSTSAIRRSGSISMTRLRRRTSSLSAAASLAGAEQVRRLFRQANRPACPACHGMGEFPARLAIGFPAVEKIGAIRVHQQSLFPAAADAVLRKHQLPELGLPAAKCTRAGEEVIPPHPVETFTVFFREARPSAFEVRVPGHQGAVIVGAEAVPVFEDKEVVHGLAELRDGGQHAAREDVSVDPGIRVGHRAVSADGVQQENPARFEAAVGEFEKTPVILVADMLAQPDRDHLVEGARGFTVVLEAKLHGEAFALFPGPFDLRGGNVVGNHLHAIALGRIAREPAPPASELEDPLAGREVQVCGR